MANFLPVINLDIRLASNGGSVRLQTNDGREFKSGLLPIPFITSIATVMNGPFPHFDHQNGVFSCGFSNGQHSGANVLPMASFSAPLNATGLFDEQA